MMVWKDYARNSAYGIKMYLLHEEAAIPSFGYGDGIIRMRN